MGQTRTSDVTKSMSKFHIGFRFWNSFAFPKKDEYTNCSAENLKSICEKFLPKFHYSTLQLQDASVGSTKLEWETIYQRLVVEKRGGLCYERDEVLWQLLNKIGYEVLGHQRFTRVTSGEASGYLTVGSYQLGTVCYTVEPWHLKG